MTLSPLHRSILHIALPSIVSNITVPLLALVDTTIAGHLGAAAYIGAISLGGMIFNMAYWLFGFLRMGTGGMTAQAYGAGRGDETLHILLRSLLVAGSIALVMWVMQGWIIEGVFRFVTAGPAVEQGARLYYKVLIWGAPAVLGLYSFAGWFLGMQNARYPMLIALVQNAVNIVASLSLVLGLGWKVEGVALGTLVAQYAGLLMAVGLWLYRYRPQLIRKGEGGRLHWKDVCNRADFARFFSVNRDIFLRTFCLIAVSTYFTSVGAAQGDLCLAANALLMQFFVLFSYVMDGFAYAGEALGGRFYGAHDRQRFKRLARSLFVWGVGLGLVFTLLYIGMGRTILGWLTDEADVRTTAAAYLPYACAIPLVSLSAFLFDGLFIGTTSTSWMLRSMAVATALFFGIIYLLPPVNASLWLAFLAYLGGRGAMQGLFWPKVLLKI